LAGEPHAAVALQTPDDQEALDPPAADDSDAERLADLQDSLEEDRKLLARLDAEWDDPASEYAMAEQDFKRLNRELEELEEKLSKLDPTDDAHEITSLQEEVQSLQRRRALAKDRFDLAIEDRKTLRQQRTILRGKIEKDQAALDELTGENRDEPQSQPPSDSDKPGEEDVKPESGMDDDSGDEPAANGEDRGQQEAEVEDEELSRAKQEAAAKEEAAEEAEEETASLAARMADTQELVRQEERELSFARKRVDLAASAHHALSEEWTRRQSEGATSEELTELRLAMGQANQRLIQARSEVTEIQERLNDRRAELNGLQASHIVALHEAQRKQAEAQQAEEQVQALRNPYTLRNILHWLIEHGPRLLLIVAGMFLFNRLAHFFAERSVRLLTGNAGRGSRMERENRAKTLVGVFQNAATVAIFVTGTMMILEEIGANITVLMGGVAVIGLAVAFGAQNLIKDYFYGFVILLENQYMLNDFVRIGGVHGQVERITLRMTVLRDSNGVVHFVPNGSITSVSNETHGWSRAVCDWTIRCEDDLESTLEWLHQVSLDLRDDSEVGQWILESPARPSLEGRNESGIQLRVTIKTAPNKHGAVKQAWLYRTHLRCAQMGILPAYPRRHLQISDAGVSAPRASATATRLAS
jgi:small conductance mechanosensitive channel